LDLARSINTAVIHNRRIPSNKIQELPLSLHQRLP
jgi:hypothetical protein